MLDAIEFISKYGWLLLPHYKIDTHEGIWTNSDEAPYHHRLGDLFFNGEDLIFSSSIQTLINLDKESKPWKIRKEWFETYIEKANEVLLDIVAYLYKKEMTKNSLSIPLIDPNDPLIWWLMPE